MLSGTKDGIVTAETSTRDSACALPKASFFSRSRMLMATCGRAGHTRVPGIGDRRMGILRFGASWIFQQPQQAPQEDKEEMHRIQALCQIKCK